MIYLAIVLAALCILCVADGRDGLAVAAGLGALLGLWGSMRRGV